MAPLLVPVPSHPLTLAAKPCIFNVETLGEDPLVRISVQKWGNSLAVRIPKAIAQESGIGSGTAVDLRLVKGSIVLKPAPKPRYTLDELLDGVTADNHHDEIPTGRPTGLEAW